MLTYVERAVDRVTLGKAVERRRLDAKLTIEDALKRADHTVSRSTWRDVEKARGSFPSRLKLQIMADAIGGPGHAAELRAEFLTLAGYEHALGEDDVSLREEVAALRSLVERWMKGENPLGDPPPDK